jgi:hypothetical protein
MTRESLNPNHIFRECDARNIFGYGSTVLKEKIRAGLIPAPKLLAPPPSRARGWFGYQIIEWQNQVDAAQGDWEAAAKQLYDARPKPPGRRKKANRPTQVKA